MGSSVTVTRAALESGGVNFPPNDSSSTTMETVTTAAERQKISPLFATHNQQMVDRPTVTPISGGDEHIEADKKEFKTVKEEMDASLNKISNKAA